MYETRSNTQYINNKLINKFVSQNGIDLRGTELHSLEDVAIFSKIFRDTRYETFRILYMSGHEVVGSDAVTSKIPDTTQIFPKFKNTKDPKDARFRGWYYYDSKMQRLNATGYYLIHNHPSGDATFSMADMQITKIFQKNIQGFLGHIILGENEFGVIDTNLHFSLFNYDDIIGTENGFTITDIQGVVETGKQYYKNSNYSVIIYCNRKALVTDVQEIKNSEFNDKNIFKYIANEKRKNGSCATFVYTTDEKVLNACVESTTFNVITDVAFVKGDDVISGREVYKLPIDNAYDVLGGLTSKTPAYKVHED